jgi:leucyl aminopeptidase
MVEIRITAYSAMAADVVVPADPVEARSAGGRTARDFPAGASELDATGLTGPRLSAFVEGLALGCYRFTKASRRADDLPTTIDLCGATDAAAVEIGLRNAAAVAWARDLANSRAGEKTPAWLGKQAVRTLGPLGVDVAVRDLEWLGRRGFGGLLAVGGGAAAPPRLIEARWRPRNARAGEHVVLVGKGITFDTGGLNRKPGTGMNTMHTDMAGGAAVLGALRLIAAGDLPIRVTALVPTAENSLSGSAYRPSDVVRHVGGRTSEIDNTDAEGRLVLADALAYAAHRLRPSALVDIATLTGAMKIALGVATGGLFATADELADGLSAAGMATGEPLWRMPMPADYEDTLDSQIADATNAPGPPGAITAALFLRPFAGDVPWAHLDVAGPARADKDDGIVTKGATGFGARLLSAWVESLV